MSATITIEDAPGTWVVRAGGAVIGESSKALILRENGYPDVVYFPRSDIATAFLDPSDTVTSCPHKGQATYYSIQTKSVTLKDAGWSYEDPKDAVAAIAGHLAFENEGVTIEKI
ncbi:DUF427 domain-containing protein [Palleronia caenipelagi]|uniref:DUF427 domain-containing protein n=1 Tax=Palleronia caenipelagi TaxID=2489174 RepID=A0A547QB65_9RHOB|nr:DUF427 domain-containing protein [Palleronia caenipelagi]TRD23622.1 DUF427 domain-containing protein [Palleronia caenipelagi]